MTGGPLNGIRSQAGASQETAFPTTEADLGRQIREASLDHAALSMPLEVCRLSRCRATCCHDGVFVNDEEAAVIDGRRGELLDYGFHRSEWRVRRDGRWKTATVPARGDELAEEFPAHFPRTRCVFLDDRHRCLLQRLSEDRSHHPWWWKPVSCWMHPLLLRRQPDGRPQLTLARPGCDPAAGEGNPGFGSCTPCGMPRGREPAWVALGGELEMLGRIGGRDLVGELKGR